ncbi:helix-turn-helix domain-containing protein [Spirosoma luteum]|uniref:helix-turn-helix domain-containing protein n=1 Tax=Spirosoma luteum TaxID=431553 RepID=UPI00036693C5|nr:winged helix-turn-helix domain-containing protein [Spirosoma luteum]
MDYNARIRESVDDLKQLEARQKLARNRDRIRFIRLLKDNTARSQKQAGLAIGLAQRRTQRLWQTYTQKGMTGLLAPTQPPAFAKLSAYQIAQLQAWLRLDQAQTLTHIQDYVQQRWAITYLISGLSKLCKRLQIKPKTARPVNRRQDLAGREAFKKTLLT